MKRVFFGFILFLAVSSMLIGLGNLPTSAAPLPKSVVIGCNQPGSLLYAMGAGFSKVIRSHTSMKVEAFPQGATVWYPMLGSGEVDFGLITPDDALAAYKGEAIYVKPSKGKGFPLRTLMHGTPIQVALLVTGDSNINTAADMKGKRMPVDYGALYAATLSAHALLANYGLTPADMKALPVHNVVAGIRALIEGRADVSYGAVGMGVVEELKAAKGARFLPLDTSPEAVKRMEAVHPGYYPIMANPRFAGVPKEMPVMGKDIVLMASDHMSDDLAYALTKVLWENYKELGSFHPRLKLWTSDRFATTHAVVPYHPGSIKLYKEKGVWTPALEAHQKKLMAIK